MWPASAPSTERKPAPAQDLAWALAWQAIYARQVAASPPALGLAAPLAGSGRTHSDALAAWQRWHMPQQDLSRLFDADQWPWYVALERARVETLASTQLPGMASNLALTQGLPPAPAALSWIYLLARTVFAGDAPATWHSRPAARQPKRGFWSFWGRSAKQLPAAPTDAELHVRLHAASQNLEDGDEFARQLQPLVTTLSLCFPLELAQGMPAPQAPGSEAAPAVQRRASADGAALAACTARNANDYSVFTRQWDEVLPASHWLAAGDAMNLQQLNHVDRRQARQLAHQLQRQLQAARQRHWHFDQEEGRLDNRRLARLLTPSAGRHVFRVEAAALMPEACVTLLVDQSASMRGPKLLMAALAIDLAVHTLDICGVACEVLGYTTRFCADNPVEQQWQADGAVQQPGRLNATRHIVYKSASQPWRRMRAGLGLMLREGFGHENIDGEALHWAARRLASQPQPHKVLIVLSDGAPYDEATARANGRNYLENHLRTVIARIEASPMQLAAIGIGHDVGRYYRQAVTLRDPAAVAPVLFSRLAELLVPASRTARS